ncbi:MAG: hypothetical protein JWP01_939 [Myxococcales bacterium]|nr:hypothetical protein [Myxococcales bacterium]
MRGAWSLVLLLGCGRFGIDPLLDAADPVPGDVPIDSAPVACAIDGDPCDDQNICTPTSSCSAGTCIGDPPLTCTVARSESEYDSTQGAGGWFYGFWNVTDDPNGTYEAATELEELAWLGSTWRPPTWQPEPDAEFTWTYLAPWGGHPGTYPRITYPIRRWVADVSGHASAVIHMNKADLNGGDGTRAILVVDGIERFRRDVDAMDGVGFTEAIPIELSIGSTVDLILDARADDGTDTTTMSMNIESR